jgi:putative glutathione S-transferase
MGVMIDGKWTQQDLVRNDSSGRFVRRDSIFRNWITSNGAPGPSGEPGFKAEKGRYHLYVSYSCPWAHRTLIFRALKGLEGMIDVSATHWRMLENGWTFEQGEGVAPDPVFHARAMHEVYAGAEKNYTGRVTVPVLFDKQSGKIVNNESSEIIRMFNSAFDGLGARAGDFYPLELRDEIDALNKRIYETVNNGVYRCGFATSQQAYDEAVTQLFDTLDFLEERLSRQRYLCGARATEADWRLYPTLARFDLVYVGHFKCNVRRIADYPNLSNYLRDLYQWPGIAATTNLTHIKRHYYESQRQVNPTGIVPKGPHVDLTLPHDRARFG